MSTPHMTVACPACYHSMSVRIPDAPAEGDCPSCGAAFTVTPPRPESPPAALVMDPTGSGAALQMAAVHAAIEEYEDRRRLESHYGNFYGALCFLALGMGMQYASAWLLPFYLGCYLLAIVASMILIGRGGIGLGVSALLASTGLPLLLILFRFLEWIN